MVYRIAMRMGKQKSLAKREKHRPARDCEAAPQFHMIFSFMKKIANGTNTLKSTT
jgi:hypothetical protein